MVKLFEYWIVKRMELVFKYKMSKTKLIVLTAIVNIINIINISK